MGEFIMKGRTPILLREIADIARQINEEVRIENFTYLLFKPFSSFYSGM